MQNASASVVARTGASARQAGIMTGMRGSHEYRRRRAAIVENGDLRVTVLEEGGHIAEIFDKRSGTNPLWTPPWASIEPSLFTRAAHTGYGTGSDAKLLAGIMGHNLCVDIFGGPSDEEAAAGLTPHGDASVVRYELDVTGDAMTIGAVLPLAELRVERRLELRHRTVRIRESIENLTACDRPIGWTEHVTLGPPFLEKGLTEFRSSATRSKVFEGAFGADDYLVAGAAFDWPLAPRTGGGTADLRRLTGAAASSAYTAHLMDQSREDAFFVAFSATVRLAFGYVWRRRDFPWLGIWEENHSRHNAPWNGATLARGMEFGVSPMPESRREMIDRGRLFDVPTYRWIPAKSRVEVDYWAVMRDVDAVPESIEHWAEGP
jgi:hypothetical protein